MEPSRHEEGRQDVLDFKCKKIILGVEKSISLSPTPSQKSATLGNLKLETIALFTPEKTNEPLQTYRDKSVELPEKCKEIVELFDRMNCSLRLLNLRKKFPTFENVCALVQVLTKREFLYSHLAQIKYILPEAVQIEKILVHDEKTLCMKPDIKITLVFDVVEGHHENSAFIALSRLFASRISTYFSSHPKEDDIPEAILPGPINQRNQRISSEALLWDSSVESQPASCSVDSSLAFSNSCSPFSGRFSQKTFVVEPKKTQLLVSPAALSSARTDSVINQSSQQKDSVSFCLKLNSIEAPQTIQPPCSASQGPSESSCLKLATVADSFMLETPAKSTPNRSVPRSDNNFKNILIKKDTSCQNPTKRFLDFSHTEGDECGLQSTMDEPGNYTVGHGTIPDTVETKSTSTTDIRTDYPAQKEMSACLPALVTLIHQIFQSASFCPVTKEELVHKIIMNSCDITDRREVEGQIEHLEKLVPDWISRRSTPSGDLLYNIRKVPDLDAVCTKLISM